MSSHPLETRLTGIRRRVRRVLWLHGLSWLTAVFLGLVLVVGGGDWLFHFDDSGVRFILLATVLGAVGWIGYRYLLTPLSVPFRDLDIARRIEDRYPGLQDSLASTVEFLERGQDPQIGSPVLQQAVIQQTMARVGRLDFDNAIQTRPLRQAAMVAAGVCLLAAGIVWFRQADARLAARRLFLPWSASAWPRQTNLRLLQADLRPLPVDSATPLRLAKGETLEFFAENTTGGLPSRVQLEYRVLEPAGGKATTETLRPTSTRDKTGTARELAAGQLPSQKGSLEFRVMGGDDNSMPWRTVLVIPPPLVEDLHVTLTPPPYTRLPVEPLPAGVGHIQGYLGTRVDFAARTNKPVKAATLRIKDAVLPAPKISEDGRQVATSFTITEPGTYSYRLELKDTEGFEGSDPPRYEIRGLQDSIPEVVIDLPASDLQVTPTAEVQIRTTAKDDLGLKGMRLVYHPAEEPGAAEGAPATPKTIPLFDGTARPQQHTATHLWKLEDLKLQAGMRIVFYVEAGDDYDLGAAHVGRSISRTLIVVSPQDKGRELAQRQANLLEELQRTTKLQENTRQQIAELQLQMRKVGKLQNADLDMLQRAELAQRQVTAQLTNPSDGLENAAREILNDLQANRLNEPEVARRAERIATELGRLATDQLPVIEQELTRAKKQAEALERGAADRDANAERPSADKSKSDKTSQKQNGKSSSEGKSGDQKEAAGKQDGTRPANESTSKQSQGDPSGKESPADAKQNSGSPSAGNGKNENGKTGEDKAGKSGAESKSGSAKESPKNPDGKNPDGKNSSGQSSGKQSPSGKQDSNPTDKSDSGKADSKESPAETAGKSDPENGKSGKNDSRKTAGNESRKDFPRKPVTAAKPRPQSESRDSGEALDRVSESQREVVETLSDLTQELAQWKSERETTDDVAELQNQQKELNKQTGELGQKTLTKPKEELTPQEQADLAKAAERQKRQADKLEQLEARMQQQAQQMESRNPSSSATLRNALEQSRQSATAGQMRDAAGQINENRLGSAAQTQQDVLRKLSDMLETLQNRRTGETESLVKKMKEAEQELDTLRNRQRDLQQQTQHANRNAEPQARKKELERLGKEQAKLGEQMKQLGRQLQRLQLHKASEAARRAAGRMEQAQQNMEQNNPEQAAEQQQESLDDLEQAQRETARGRREAEEQLAQEQLEKIADQLQAMIGREQQVLDETRRLEGLRSPEGKLSRAQLRALSDLAENQQNLQQETQRLVKKLTAAEAFALSLKGAARQMQRAVELLGERQTGEPTQRAETAARQRFVDLIAALNPDKKPGGGKQQKQQGGEGSGQQGGAPQGDGISGLSQLKILKSLQQELLERTAELAKKRDEQQGVLTAVQQQELEELARDQGAVADLARNLMQQALENAQDDEEAEAADEAPSKKPTDRPKNREKQPKQEEVPLLKKATSKGGGGF